MEAEQVGKRLIEIMNTLDWWNITPEVFLGELGAAVQEAKREGWTKFSISLEDLIKAPKAMTVSGDSSEKP